MSTKTCHRCGKPLKGRSDRARVCTLCFRKNEREYGERRRSQFSPERRRASNLVYTAVLNGVLIKQRCEVCGTKKGIQAHHDDYAKPLDVRWLCRSHHKQHHVKFGPALNSLSAAA